MERTLVALPAGYPCPLHNVRYVPRPGYTQYIILGVLYDSLYPSPTLSECGAGLGAVVASVDVDVDACALSLICSAPLTFDVA